MREVIGIGLGQPASPRVLLQVDAKREGLRWVELTTKLDNVASQRVIDANGGRLVERFTTPGEYGEGEALRFRIDLQ